MTTTVEKITKLSDALYEKQLEQRKKILTPLVDVLKSQGFSADSLTVQELDSFTVFGDNKQIDLVKQKSEEYFIENVKYFMDPALLEIMEWEKPDLSATRLELIKNDKAGDFYKNYGKIWIHLVVSEELKDKITFKQKVLEQDLNKVASNNVSMKQTAKLYFLSYLNHVPKMALYANEPKKWAENLKKYYLSDEFADIWVHKLKEQLRNENTLNKFKDFLKSHTETAKLADAIPKDVNSLDYLTSDIRAKLEILDPTGKTSNQVISHLYNINLSFMALEGGQLDENFEKVLEYTVEDILKKFNEMKEADKSLLEKESITTVKELIKAFGGLKGASALVIKVNRDAMKRYRTYLDRNIQVTDSSQMAQVEADTMQASIDAEDVKFRKVSNIYNFCAGVWRATQALGIIYGIATWDSKSPALNQISFVGDSVAVFLDIMTTRRAMNIYFTKKCIAVGKLFAKCFTKFTATKLGGLFSKGFALFFKGTANDFIAFRVCPVLLLVSCAINIWDAKNDIEEKNWGALVCDLAALGCNFAAACVLFAGLSWSGPFALIMGGFVIGFLLIKYIFFPSKSPAEKFAESKFMLDKYVKVTQA